MDHGGTRHPPRVSKERVLETLHLKLCAPQIYPDRQRRGGKTQGVIHDAKTCSATLRRATRVTTVLDDPRGGQIVASPYLTTHGQPTPRVSCLTTHGRHGRLERGAWRLPAVADPRMPYSTTLCRTSSPEGRLDGPVPATTRCRRGSTASSGRHPWQSAWARVIKHRARPCWTTSGRHGHPRTGLGDHMPYAHGSGGCWTTGGRRVLLSGGLEGTASSKYRAADAG